MWKRIGIALVALVSSHAGAACLPNAFTAEDVLALTDYAPCDNEELARARVLMRQTHDDRTRYATDTTHGRAMLSWAKASLALIEIEQLKRQR